jgi:UDP-N-acetylmuramoyl-tripeptide--D-alanyl-D-alanine ligase
METRSLGWIAESIGAECPPECLDFPIHEICTDTRSATPGCVFVALVGERDGHSFVFEAFLRGAVAAIVSRPVEGCGPLLMVPDTLLALGKLAKCYRDEQTGWFLAVTGSVGKTTTKEMLAHLLRSKYRVHTSPGNFNNEIGVPLALLDREPSDELSVIELAMRGRGQIKYLAEMVAPDIGIITRIGFSHLELLGSRLEIARAKAELLEVILPNDLAILPADDEYLDELRAHVPAEAGIRTFGVAAEADFRLDNIVLDSEGRASFTINGHPFQMNAPGIHLAYCAAAACAAVEPFNLGLADCADILSSFEAPNMRMQSISLRDGGLLLNDCYNAAPDSMEAALQTLDAMQRNGGRTVAVLGEMRELGTGTEEGHRGVGKMVSKTEIGLLATIGEQAALIADAAGSAIPAVHFATTQDAVAELPMLLKGSDTILVKGSRALGMEKLVEAIRQTLA